MNTYLESLHSWLVIIRHGRFTSTYKIALGFAVARFVEKGRREVNNKELAEVFFDLYLDRLKMNMPQISRPKRTTIVEQVIAGYRSGRLSKADALEQIQKKAFTYVLPSFHIVNRKPLPLRFYTYHNSGITLTDNAYQVFLSPEKEMVLREMASTWDRLEQGFAFKRAGLRAKMPLRVADSDMKK